MIELELDDLRERDDVAAPDEEREVLRQRRAHCLEGAMLAACAELAFIVPAPQAEFELSGRIAAKSLAGRARSHASVSATVAASGRNPSPAASARRMSVAKKPAVSGVEPCAPAMSSQAGGLASPGRPVQGYTNTIESPLIFASERRSPVVVGNSMSGSARPAIRCAAPPSFVGTG